MCVPVTVTIAAPPPSAVIEGKPNADTFHHYLRSTMQWRERTQVTSSPDFPSSSAASEQRDRPHSSQTARRLCDENTILSIANRLHTTQLRVLNAPKPPPCIAASSARRDDFSKRHVGSAPPRRCIADEPYSQHFFIDGQRRKIEAATSRDKQDLLAHDKMHHTIDKGTKFDVVDMEVLVKRLKEDAVTHKEHDHARLTDKYVDRIRKRGCPQPPGRRRHRHAKSSPKKMVAATPANNGMEARKSTVSPVLSPLPALPV